MCYEERAAPPLPPIAGGAAAGRLLTLQAPDGTQVAAFAATAGRAGGAGIVIMPDVRGLHPFYVELTERFAEAGVHAVAIDYFGRTAPAQIRGEDFKHKPHVEQTTPEGIAADVTAAVAHLRSDEGGAATRVFTVGFCFGGRNALNQAAAGHGLGGAIGFYPGMGERHKGDHSTPIRLAPAYRCPVLALFGGADASISSSRSRSSGTPSTPPVSPTRSWCTRVPRTPSSTGGGRNIATSRPTRGDGSSPSSAPPAERGPTRAPVHNVGHG